MIYMGHELYPLVDALQFPIEADYEKKRIFPADGDTVSAIYEIGDSGYFVSADRRIRASYLDDAQAWVLLNVLGDLCLLLHLTYNREVFESYLLDISETPLTPKMVNAIDGKPFSTAFPLLEPSILKKFDWSESSNKWVPTIK